MKSKFKKELKGKDMLIDYKGKIELSRTDAKIIKYWLKRYHYKEYRLPIIIPINKQIALDFIGWDNEDYNDVIIIKNYC